MRQKSDLAVVAVRLALLIVGFGVWEWAMAAKVLSPLLFGRPTAIAAQLGEMLVSKAFWTVDFWFTLREILFGLAIGGTGGLVVASLLARFDFGYRVLIPVITGAYALPRIALAPLFILWFGIGIASKVALVVSLVYFIVFYNSYAGFKHVDKELVETVKTMGASELFLWRWVIVPSALPFIISGLRVALAFGMTGAIAGEMITSQHGLGNIIADAAGRFDTDRMFAVLVVVAAFALVVYQAVDVMERRLLRWRPLVEINVR